jgi:anthranilate phosphoribosyltransferase
MLKTVLQQLLSEDDLEPDAAREAFACVFSGDADPVVVSGFLVALQGKGVTADELAAAATVMRQHSLPIDVGDASDLIDTCGTGGTGSGTFNVSTAAALVAAAAGVRVVKHGNRAASSKTGSADVLETLGVRLDKDPKEQLNRCGIAFAFARNHHPAMKHVAPIRQALGVPTVFNLLGPLTNPAGVRRQLLGVAKPEHSELLANALLRLGSDRAWVVHSDDGQDDLSCVSPTRVSEVRDGSVTTWTFDPSPLGLTGSVADLQADSPAESAAMIRRVFDGEPGPARDAILLNAAAALVVAGAADDVETALPVVTEVVDTGRAGSTLDRLAYRG